MVSTSTARYTRYLELYPPRQELTPAKRAHIIQKLSCILQQKPSGRHSPTFSSLDWLPNSLANWIRKTGTLGVLHGCKDKPHPPQSPILATKTYPCTKTGHSTTKANTHKLGNKELWSHSGVQVCM